MKKELEQKANAIREELLSLEIVKECYNVSQVYNYCCDAYIVHLLEKEPSERSIYLPLTVMEVIVKYQLRINIQNIGSGKNCMRINIWVS